MDGLMQPAAPAGAPMSAAPPDSMQEAPGWLAGEDQPASPEEQDLYEQFIARAWDLVYRDDKVFEDIKNMLSTGDPVLQLSKISAWVVFRVKHAADQAGKEIPGDVVLHAGKFIFEDFAELATKLGAHDFKNDTKALEAAWLRAMDEFRLMAEADGSLDQKAAQADLQEFQKADQDGSLKAGFQDMIAKGRMQQPRMVSEAEGVEPETTGLQPPKKGAKK
jgi:hypothetical protein